MQQKFITAGNISLSYLESNADNENTIFFLHANSSSAKTWEKQLTDPVLSGYRLIAFDLPAHGASAASENPDEDYSVIALGRIMAEAVLLLATGKYIIGGISLGSSITGEMLANNLDPAGIFVAGSTLLGEGFTLENISQPGVDLSFLFTDDAPVSTIAAYASLASFSTDQDVIQGIIQDYFLVKPPFRSTLLTTLIAGKVGNEIKLVEEQDKPVLAVFGKEDQLVKPDSLDKAPFQLFQNHVSKLPHSSHLVNLDDPKSFSLLLAIYAKAQFTIQDSSWYNMAGLQRL
jgi:pimeloyl-ACP methyl ester carboxylesterase